MGQWDRRTVGRPTMGQWDGRTVGGTASSEGKKVNYLAFHRCWDDGQWDGQMVGRWDGWTVGRWDGRMVGR